MTKGKGASAEGKEEEKEKKPAEPEEEESEVLYLCVWRTPNLHPATVVSILVIIVQLYCIS